MEKECLFCGTLLEEYSKEKYVCEECQTKMNLLKQIKKIDSAKEKIEKATKKYLKIASDYSNERKIMIENIIKNKYVFKSTEEICFAMQLEHENIKCYPNFKIGEYSVDFLLPSLKKNSRNRWRNISYR